MNSASGDEMSNTFQEHSWLNYVAVAVCTSLVNAMIAKVRKIFSSPGREDFQRLEARLANQIAGVQGSMSRGMQDLQGRIESLGTKVYSRIDEKCDAINERIDKIVLDKSGGR